MGGGASKPAPNPDKVDLSHFEMGAVLGKGGFGVVKAVKKYSEPKKGQWFAIKMLKKSFIVEKKCVDQVFTEVELLRTLNHQFICNAHYAFQDERKLYLIMDVAMGGDLRYHLNHVTVSGLSKEAMKALTSGERKKARQRLNRQASKLQNVYRSPLPNERSVFYVMQILMALEYLHGKRVLHRDIKPENVLMRSNGYIKLTDFGLSWCAPPENKEFVCCLRSGTRGYCAPEVYTKSHHHSAPLDFFAVGVMLHEFLVVKRPFKRSSFENSRAASTSRFLADKNAKYEPLRVLEDCKVQDLNSDAVDLLRKLLMIDPRQRIGYTGGASSILKHPYFADVYTDEIITQMKSEAFKAPWIPIGATDDAPCIELDDALMEDMIAGKDTRHNESSHLSSLQNKSTFEGYSMANAGPSGTLKQRGLKGSPGLLLKEPETISEEQLSSRLGRRLSKSSLISEMDTPSIENGMLSERSAPPQSEPL